jgi:hypothetical protein
VPVIKPEDISIILNDSTFNLSEDFVLFEKRNWLSKVAKNPDLVAKWPNFDLIECLEEPELIAQSILWTHTFSDFPKELL